MKKIICFFSEENNCVLLSDEPGAMSVYLTSEQATAMLARPALDEVLQPSPTVQSAVSSTQVDELIALKKGGFSATEIIELKQSQLL